MNASRRDPVVELSSEQRSQHDRAMGQSGSSGGGPRFPTGRPANWLFRIAAAFAALFVLTVLLLSAAAFSNVRSPSAAFVERHGGALIALGVGGTLLFGLAAMTVDRLATLRSSRRTGRLESLPHVRPSKNANPTDGPGDDRAA
ncbi:MAG: hypothetical protein WD069_09230 [Planctomycetales bacterium]